MAKVFDLTMVLTRSGRRAIGSSLFTSATAASTTEYTLTDNVKNSMFEMKLDNGYATVPYEKHGSTYILTHSSVPEEYQGKGIGTVLAEKTFNYIAENNLKMKIECSFLLKVFNANVDKYKEYIA